LIDTNYISVYESDTVIKIDYDDNDTPYDGCNMEEVVNYEDGF
jgi:hypothetical protein